MTFSLSLSRFHTTKTTTEKSTFAPGSWTQIHPDTTYYIHMEKFGKNHNTQVPTRNPSTLPFLRDFQFFRWTLRPKNVCTIQLDAPHWTKPPVVLDKRLEKFSLTLDKLFKKRIGKPNLLPYQTRTLQQLQLQQDFLICPSNKNLGPAIIEYHNYINIAMRDHLLDGRTYEPLSKADCSNHKQRLEHEIKAWMKTYHKNITKMERAFLKQGLKDNKKAFCGFYLTLKAHKLKPGQNVTHLISRPIVTCLGSLLHPLGIWTDLKLQTLAKEQVSYFQNSNDLRQDLCSTHYHPTAQLFTANAISMYTNIPTNTAIMLIAKHIRTSIPEVQPKQNEE